MIMAEKVRVVLRGNEKEIGEKKYAYLDVRTPTGMRQVRIAIPPKEEVVGIKTGFIGSGFMAPYPYPMFMPPTEKKERIFDGVKIPEIITEREEEAPVVAEELKRLNIQYPLIIENGKTMAYARIFYDSRTNELIYIVVEPPLREEEKKLLNDIKGYIQEKIDIDFTQIKKTEAVDYIKKLFENSFGYFKSNLNQETKTKLMYYVFRDFIGLEKLEPLLKDKMIEDISCDGTNIPIYVYHRNPKIGSVKTNVLFPEKEELDSFVNKVAERCGRSISMAKPLVDGSLPDGSRVQATLGSDIARLGSNLTIRMFTENPITPTDIIKSGTCDLKQMAYYWFLIEHGSSILIAGGTASGKTSLLNALSLFIKHQMKVVSIEDTAELRLPHPHWVPEVARSPIAEQGKVDMFELLRESLRQRPDYIIVGEVRGKEAYVLFQQMAVGHSGLSTIHAENFPKLVDRLTSPPINLSLNLMENLDCIIFLKRVRSGNQYKRRVSTSMEVVGFDRTEKEPITCDVFQWDPKRDTFKILSKSPLLKNIAEKNGMSNADVVDDLKNKAKVLEWFTKKNITDYRKIGQVINLFYTSPEFLLEKIEGEL